MRTKDGSSPGVERLDCYVMNGDSWLATREGNLVSTFFSGCTIFAVFARAGIFGFSNPHSGLFLNLNPILWKWNCEKTSKIISITTWKENEIGNSRRMSQENATRKQPLICPINRQQMSWRAVDVERLIGEDHRARPIWTLVGCLDLKHFCDFIESSAEEGGRRPAIDPQLPGRTHQNVVIAALANKLVRVAWAVLCKNERYRAPVLAVTT
jgi:hypothetical protein